MEITVTFVAVGLIAGLVVGLVRSRQRARDHERWKVERRAYEQEQQHARQQECEAEARRPVKLFYPHLQKAVADGIRSGESVRTVLRKALLGQAGVVLGTNHLGLPAVLHRSTRTKTVALVGKSGHGKSSVLVHLVEANLRSRDPVIVICPERELFEDFLLGLLPAERVRDLVFLAPGRWSTITFNPFVLEPGDDPARLAAELVSVFKRAMGEDRSLGPRSEPLLANAIALVVGRPGASLTAVRAVLTDPAYRAHVVAECRDPYLRDYWERVVPKYPAGAETPLLNRLDNFLRNPRLRDVLINPVSSVSLRRVIERRLVLFVDLSALSPETMLLVGGALIAKLTLELVRREKDPGSERYPVFCYVDEFPAVAGTSEASWRTLLSRGRKYGAALCLAFQNPGQLPQRLRDELFGNTSTIFSFNVSAKDASTIRRELLMPAADGSTRPVAIEKLVSLGVGEAIGRIGTGACAMGIKFKKPFPEQNRAQAARVREVSLKTHGVRSIPETPASVRLTTESTATPSPYEGPTAPLTSAPPTSSAEARAPSDDTMLTVSVSAQSLATHEQASRLVSRTPRPPTPPPEGRGGRDHKYLQSLIKNFGHSRGYRATIEKRIPGGSVDVALERNGVCVAIEVSITSSPKQELEHVRTALAAGFDHAVVVSQNWRGVAKIEKRVSAELSESQQSQVHFFEPEALFTFLDSLDAKNAGAESTVCGYNVKVGYRATNDEDVKARQKAISEVVASTLKRMKD